MSNMLSSFRGWSLGCVISGVLLSAGSAQAQETEGVVRLGQRSSGGVVRISDQPQSRELTRGQSPSEIELANGEVEQTRHCESQDIVQECPQGQSVQGQIVECHDHVPLPYKMAAWIHNDIARKGAWIRGKCGYDECKEAERAARRANGGCRGDGHGRPLMGHYHIVYPVDPGYFDQRDGQVYAAPGYGGPVSVPLAPVVNHTWNYGWGVPSSRLTPVQHPVTQAPVSQYPSPYPMAPVSY